MSINVYDAGNLPITPDGLRQFAKSYRKHFPHLTDYDPSGMLCRRVEKAADEIERLTHEASELEQLREALRDVLPYARACIGLPECSWPSDSVILKARKALGGVE